MFIFLAFITFILTILHIWIRYRRFGRLFDEIPGSKPLPFFGNLIPFFNLSSRQLWVKFYELQEKYPVLRIWSFCIGMVVTRDPDHVKAILSSKVHINKHTSGYKNIRFCGNDGVVVSGDELWAQRRKILNQAFTINILEIYSEKLDDRVKKLTRELLSHDSITVHDVSQISMKFAFEVVCEATMNFDFDTETELKGRQFRDAFIEVGEVCYYRVSHPHVRDWMMKFLPIGRKQQKLWAVLTDFATKVIDDRRKYHEAIGYNAFNEYLVNIEKGIYDKEKDITGRNKKLSVVDVLLLNEQKGLIDSKGVLDETILMIAAGFETTGVAIMFLILLLAENKKVQDLAREEILNVVGDHDNEITMEHIKNLDYLERCAKESMRLFTVTPYIGRSVEKELNLGKYTVPIGTELYISVFGLHRDPNVWHDPLKFDPDRFLPENFNKQHPFSYIPFSRGPRSCIGQKLAMKEIKVIVAHILQNFYLEPIDRTEDFKFRLGVTLQADTARVRFIKINNVD